MLYVSGFFASFINPNIAAFRSALNNLAQFIMFNAGSLTPYIGFNEDEVIDLCERFEKLYSILQVDIVLLELS